MRDFGRRGIWRRCSDLVAFGVWDFRFGVQSWGSHVKSEAFVHMIPGFCFLEEFRL